MTAAIAADTGIRRPLSSTSSSPHTRTMSEAVADRAHRVATTLGPVGDLELVMSVSQHGSIGTQQTLASYQRKRVDTYSIGPIYDAVLSILVESSSDIYSIGREVEALYLKGSEQDAKDLTATLERLHKRDRSRTIWAAILTGLGIRPRLVRTPEQRLNAALRRIREAEAQPCQ